MINDSFQKHTFYSQGALRILTGLLFMQHGLQKYFQYPPGGHHPAGLFPVVNGGDLAILFCFVFLYLAFAGLGAWRVGTATGQPRIDGGDNQ